MVVFRSLSAVLCWEKTWGFPILRWQRNLRSLFLVFFYLSIQIIFFYVYWVSDFKCFSNCQDRKNFPRNFLPTVFGHKFGVSNWVVIVFCGKWDFFFVVLLAARFLHVVNIYWPTYFCKMTSFYVLCTFFVFCWTRRQIFWYKLSATFIIYFVLVCLLVLLPSRVVRSAG